MHSSLIHLRKKLTWLVVAKIVIVLIPIGLLINLANDHYFLTKTLSVNYRPGQKIRIIQPQNAAKLIRTADPKLPWQIITDSFLFNVTIPRLIDSIQVRARLNIGTQPYIGLTAYGKNGANSTSIVYSKALNELSWKRISKGAVTIWMRDTPVAPQNTNTATTDKATPQISRPAAKQYASVDAFLADPPSAREVGVAGIDPMAVAKITGYQPSTTPVAIGHTLRGSHQLYVYAAHETLHMAFDKIDMNRTKGRDDVTVRVSRVDDITAGRQQWIKTVTVGDDGNSSDQGPRGKAQPVIVDIPDTRPGMYLIDIATSEDVLLMNITSNQQYLSFNHRVYIADGPAYGDKKFTPVTLQTQGSTVSVAVNHDQGKQDVVIAGRKVSIKDVKVDHVISQLKTTTTLAIPKGDIIVSSDGLLAFSGSILLPAGSRTINLASAIFDPSLFDYVVADYIPFQDGRAIVNRTFALSDLALASKTLTFSIDAPGMTEAGSTVGLDQIRITMKRGAFPWKKVWAKIGFK